jgi:hypothetical protein
MHVLRQTAFNNAINQIAKFQRDHLEPALSKTPKPGREMDYVKHLGNLCRLIKEQYEHACQTLNDEIAQVPVTDTICPSCIGTGTSGLGIWGRGCARCVGTGSGKVQERLDNFRRTCK